MTYVCVVTFSKLDAEKGEFFTETAFEQLHDAMKSATQCMETHGGIETYMEVYRDSLPHVLRSWNNPDWTVWIERLELKT